MDLLKVRWTLLGFLLLTNAFEFWANAAYPGCTYKSKIESYYVYGLRGYTWRGLPSTNCQWHIFSDTRVRFTCRNRVQVRNI